MNDQLIVLPFDGLVWAVRPDFACENFALQLRFPEEKQAKYLTFNAASQHLTSAFGFANSWWSEALALENGVLLIGYYPDPSMPILSKIIAFDVATGKQQWEKADFQFQKILNGMVVGVNLNSKETIALDLINGNQASELKDEVDENGYLKFPTWKTSENDLQVAFLEAAGIEIMAWHQKMANGYTLFLEAGPSQAPLLQLELESEMEKMHPAPFFVAGEWLVAVQDRVALVLWKLED